MVKNMTVHNVKHGLKRTQIGEKTTIQVTQRPAHDHVFYVLNPHRSADGAFDIHYLSCQGDYQKCLDRGYIPLRCYHWPSGGDLPKPINKLDGPLPLPTRPTEAAQDSAVGALSEIRIPTALPSAAGLNALQLMQAHIDWMERPFEMNGQVYSPFKDWSPEACRRAGFQRTKNSDFRKVRNCGSFICLDQCMTVWVCMQRCCVYLYVTDLQSDRALGLQVPDWPKNYTLLKEAAVTHFAAQYANKKGDAWALAAERTSERTSNPMVPDLYTSNLDVHMHELDSIFDAAGGI